jgi:hypothetical protein
MLSSGGSMHHDEHAKKAPHRSSYQSFLQGRKLAISLVVTAVVVLLLCWVFLLNNSTSVSRTDSYKKVNGVAGLDAHIEYDCTKNCGQKYGFNVYLFNADGQQVSVVRPDKNGHVRLAMPAGDYMMLVGKQFGNDKLFPQEKLLLKNGQELSVKLQYKEGAL